MLQEQLIAGLTAKQLEVLCQSGQIARTMYLLFSLNHWAKARERLFFADRQGLYRVKAAILCQAYAVGSIEATAYIDGVEGFGAGQALTLAAEMGSETVLWHLEKQFYLSEVDPSTYLANQLYTRMTGKEHVTAADIEKLDRKEIEEYIRVRLVELEQDARRTRQPIARGKLRDLCVTPGEFLDIMDHRRFYDLLTWESWDQLEESELRKLDPEGLSLVAFRYISPMARYCFHLPLRVAETFVPRWTLAQLKSASRSSRESGEYYGRPITENEGLQQPVAHILRELGVEVATICPRLLCDKREHALERAMRFAAWSEAEDLDAEAEEMNESFWQSLPMLDDGLEIPPSSMERVSTECPLCFVSVNGVSRLARLEHWSSEHCGQDLTISQASWVLKRPMDKKDFCQHYPSDYRAPHERGWGTRYWRLTTLAEWLKNEEL
jgi:hypothetical protein